MHVLHLRSKSGADIHELIACDDHTGHGIGWNDTSYNYNNYSAHHWTRNACNVSLACQGS